MSKEMIITSTPQETKVAILEEDQLVEVHIERSHEQGLVGSIYKGRVTKVLPGMQSAFVNVGLERDAFLYVSDFFEDAEEYDSIVTTVEEKIEKLDSTPGEMRSLAPAFIEIPTVIEAEAPVAPAALPPVAESAVTTQPPTITEKAAEAAQQEKNGSAESTPHGRRELERQGRGRYGRRRGRRRPWERNREEQAKPATTPAPMATPTPAPATETPSPAPLANTLTPLPGESLSKFQSNAFAETQELFSAETAPVEPATPSTPEKSEALDAPEAALNFESTASGETTLASSPAEIAAAAAATASASAPLPEDPVMIATASREQRSPAIQEETEKEPLIAEEKTPSAVDEAAQASTENVGAASESATAPVVGEIEEENHGIAGEPEDLAPVNAASQPEEPAIIPLTVASTPESASEPRVIDSASFRTPLEDKLQVPAPSKSPLSETPPVFSHSLDLGSEEEPEAKTAPLYETAMPQEGGAVPSVMETPVADANPPLEIHSAPTGFIFQKTILEAVESTPDVQSAVPPAEAPLVEPTAAPVRSFEAVAASEAVAAAEVPPVENAAANGAAIPSIESTVMPTPWPGEIATPEIPAVAPPPEAAPKVEAAPPMPAVESSPAKAPSRFQEKHLGRSRYDKSRFERKSAATAPLAEVYGPPTPYEFMTDAEKSEYNARKAAEKISAKIQESTRKMATPQPRERESGYQRGRRGRRGRKRFGDREPREEQAPAREEKKPAGRPMIADLLREGQEILVQIAKEPLGKKGARITSHIALPGRYLVYMPTVDHIGVSRKIGSDEERHRLKRSINENRVGLTGGFIVRTAAEGRSEEELKQDIRFLATLWADVRARAEKRPAPALLHRDLGVLERILRDQLSSEFTAIRLDNETEYAKVLEFVNQFQPALVGRVKLHFKDTPIFEEHGIDHEIEKALKAKVWLKSGGYIVINQTEAMVAIDVNTGKFVGKTARLEDTIVKTNIDAAKEVARQIRLRDMGGIIVVDFIDMEERRNRQKVIQSLEEAMHNDRAPYKILAFNDFGLVALTRKRVKQSLEKTLLQPCSYCQGHGMIKSIPTVCYEIQAEAKKMAPLLDGREIRVRVHPDVAKALKTFEQSVITEIESHTRKDVIIKSDASTHQDQFEIY